MRDFLAYAQFGMFWDRFLPETPFGRAEKEAMTTLGDHSVLNQVWDETETAIALLEGLDEDAVRLSQIQHHLKRLPRFCEDPKAVFDEVEIFQFKKFLHNFKSLATLLDPDCRSAFGLFYVSEPLEQLLDKGRQSAESFYVADAYSSALEEIRKEIREIDDAIRGMHERRAAEITARWGFEFGARAFLLVARESLGRPESADDLMLVEPYDETKYAIRPKQSAGELILPEQTAARHRRGGTAGGRPPQPPVAGGPLMSWVGPGWSFLVPTALPGISGAVG